MRTFIFFWLSTIIFCSNAQTVTYNSYKFDEVGERMKLTDEELQESFVILSDKRAFEYIINEDEKLAKLDFRYRKVRLNDDKAVEGWNKVYVPLSNVVNIIDIQARSITKDGVVTEIDKTSIKEVENMEEYGSFKVFAIEGLEVGCDLEFFYILEKEPTYCECGDIVFQTDDIIKKIEFELISPQWINFLVKSYNGLAEPIIDTTADGRNIISILMDEIPKAEDEDYSSYDANLMRMEYKFRNNAFNTKAEVMTYASFAKQYFAFLYSPDSKAESEINKILAKLKVKKLEEADKIMAIENHIKKNYFIRSDADDESINDLQFILSKGYTHDLGMARLFAKFFELSDIEHYIGLTTDRYDSKFDKDFQSWNYLDEFVIYFPKTDNYLCPTDISSRYGMLPYEFTNNYGVFIKPVEVGSVKSGVPKVRFIPALPLENTYYNMLLNVEFDENIIKTSIKSKYVYASHFSYQPVFEFLSDEDKMKFIENVLKDIGEDAEIISHEILNDNFELSPIGDEPFTIVGEITISSLIEKAGNSILFKVGELIGRQMEMYQEHERQYDVEIEYPHSLNREIRIKIPEGYVVKGLEGLVINIEYGEKGKKSVGFVSSYKQEGNEIIISITEYYAEVFYPISEYEHFREVINAAADFNKITLVFEKK
ncbi:DUF3857 domain-containing protein [Bacteroidota bacterium]